MPTFIPILLLSTSAVMFDFFKFLLEEINS